MNKKRVLSVLAAITVLVIAVTALVACDHYKWNSVGAGDSSAAVVSNGGYYVEQGKYVYFINGYVGDGAANEWGTPYKQSIMRAEKNADGSVNNDTATVVVPKSIYNTSVNGGFAVFGEWIYYATPNSDKDKSGTASTTNTDFMRTRTDGAITQKIATINTRTSEYLFTPTRVLYRTDTSTVYYIDFSGMPTNKSVNNGKGAVHGTLISNATSIAWGYDVQWNPQAGGVASDYIFFTESLTGDDSYKFYNNLCAIKYDGTDKRVLATYNSYFGEGDSEESTPDKVYNFTVQKVAFNADDTATLYYTKKINSTTNADKGLYSNVFSLKDGFSATAEKQVSATAVTTFYPLGGDKGVFATQNSAVYYVNGNTNFSEQSKVIGADKKATVLYVEEVSDGVYVYYKDSTGTALYRIKVALAADGKVTALKNEETVVATGVKTDWLNPEFCGGAFYYFDTEDYNYVHRVNLSAFDGNSDKGTLIGKMTEEDAKAKEEAEKNMA